MSRLVLVVGSPNYSSWSLRPWLVLSQAGFTFETEIVRLRRRDTKAAIRARSPSGLVPVLLDGPVVVWDSLAIAEYLAEKRPLLWPAEPVARAFARSAAAEMHAGFRPLREHLPMDWRGRHPGRGLDSPGVADDVARILEIWNACRSRFGAGGPFLFGHFTIADAMYAPVASRFVTYGVALDPVSAAYVEAVMALPPLARWAELAARDLEAADADDTGEVPASEPPALVAFPGGRPADRTPPPARAAGQGPVRVDAPREAPPSRDSGVKPIGAGTRRRRDDTPPA